MKTILGLAALALAGQLLSQPFTLDTTHSEVGFKVKHLMISTVPGKFKTFTGNFDFDAKKGVLKDVEVEIDIKSIDTNVEARDKHLVSADFFDAEKHPKATFKAAGPVKVKAGKVADVPGTLTLRGVAKPITLKVEYAGATTDPWGNDKVGFEAKAALKRSDYGMTWNKQLDKGGVVVSDEVKLEIAGEANAVKPEAKDKK